MFLLFQNATKREKEKVTNFASLERKDYSLFSSLTVKYYYV